MGKQYCGNSEQLRRLNDILPHSVERLSAEFEELESALADITTCPGPCDDGMVLVSPQSGTPRHCRCPITSRYCGYGIGLESKLDAYLNKLMIEAEIPRRHVENFDDYCNTETLTWVRKWNFHGFLVLSGGSGIGKSFGAAWSVREYLRSRIPDTLDVQTWNYVSAACENVMWSSANRIIHDGKMASKARESVFLVIDDLGREGESQLRRTDIADVISARYDTKLPTVITTELTMPDIIEVYGLYAAHKLTEDSQSDGSGGIIVECRDNPANPGNKGR